MDRKRNSDSGSQESHEEQESQSQVGESNSDMESQELSQPSRDQPDSQSPSRGTGTTSHEDLKIDTNIRVVENTSRMVPLDRASEEELSEETRNSQREPSDLGNKVPKHATSHGHDDGSGSAQESASNEAPVKKSHRKERDTKKMRDVVEHHKKKSSKSLKHSSDVDLDEDRAVEHVRDRASADTTASRKVSKKHRNMNHLPEIVVCCGTGRIGMEVVKSLIETEMFKVSVLTRDPTTPMAAQVERMGARLIRVSMKDRKGLEESFRGAFGVFSMQPSPLDHSSMSYDDEFEMAQNVNVAAKDAGIQHLVYLSMIGAGDTCGFPAARTKGAVESHLEVLKDKLNWTVVRIGFLMENFDPKNGPNAPDSKGVGGFAGRKVKVPYTSLHDVVEAVSEAFKQGPARLSHKTIQVIGEYLDMKQIAQILTGTTKTTVVAKKQNIFRKFKKSDLDKFLRTLAKDDGDDASDVAHARMSFKEWARRSFPKNWEPERGRVLSRVL